MSAKSFVKTVKNARRGVNFAKKFHHKLALAVFMFLGLIGGSGLFVWWQERNFTGSYFDSLWTVLFTLIGQGEFANSPHTLGGRIMVFLLSIFGVALFGVVFAEVMQRIINSRIKAILGEMMGINTCKYEGHILVCGWNARGTYLIREILSSGQQAALIAKERPADLDSEVFFVQGNPSEREALLKGGITHAQGAIILGDPSFGDDDSHSILTALAVEDTAPDVYTVMELHNPDNERYAHYAHVDDILYSDSLIAGITSMCTHNEGISAFIRDILSTADEGHSFATVDLLSEHEGKTIDTVFAELKEQDILPIGILAPGREGAPVSDWVSTVNPDGKLKITLPMKAVCIVKDNYAGNKN
ncbi:MAG: potassium channel protein [Synergistaceae bacterium]|nr:potassium channel protein [Synergistaceae bacterium]